VAPDVANAVCASCSFAATCDASVAQIHCCYVCLVFNLKQRICRLGITWLYSSAAVPRVVPGKSSACLGLVSKIATAAAFVVQAEALP